MRRRSRSRLSVTQRREQLLQLGLVLFSEQPYEQASIDEIAHRAGISRGLLYHYFPRKRDFYVAVVRRAVEELTELIRPDPGLEPAAQTRQALRSYFTYAQQHREGFVTAVLGGAGAGGAVQEVTDAFRDRVIAQVRTGFDDTQQPAPGDPDIVGVHLRAWVGYVEALTLGWLRAGGPDIDELVDMATRALAVNLAGAGAGVRR